VYTKILREVLANFDNYKKNLENSFLRILDVISVDDSIDYFFFLCTFNADFQLPFQPQIVLATPLAKARTERRRSIEEWSCNAVEGYGIQYMKRIRVRRSRVVGLLLL